MVRVLVRAGQVVLPTGIVKAGVLIEGEKIRTIASDSADAGLDRVVDAEGCYVIPGGVDPHVHTNLELGGYTTRDDFGPRSCGWESGETAVRLFSDLLYVLSGRAWDHARMTYPEEPKPRCSRGVRL